MCPKIGEKTHFGTHRTLPEMRWKIGRKKGKITLLTLYPHPPEKGKRGKKPRRKGV
jgi:hypothetical protein